MAYRIHEQVVKGEIDNRTRGRVRGRIWLAGKAQPILLELAGNCLRDMAGCILQFVNPAPKLEDVPSLNIQQTGRVGDMTASRKVRVLDVPVREAMRLAAEDLQVPSHMGNCLYLEWFSESNGRVVLETTDYIVTLSTPEWSLSPEAEAEQAHENHESIREWLEQLGEVSTDDDDF